MQGGGNLKNWEKPRDKKRKRNNKGKGGSARQRQKRKQFNQLRKKLKGHDQHLSSFSTLLHYIIHNLSNFSSYKSDNSAS